MKNLAKRAYNLIASKISLQKYQLKLIFVFHTEKIYNDVIFSDLKEFCVQYFHLTGAKPICTIIPPTNLKLKMEMKEASFTEKSFIERLITLEEICTLGYHGHFYQNDEPEYWNAIHCNSFERKALETQFAKDLDWFKLNGFNHNGIYAGGWWFMNQVLIDLLVQNDFCYDFSFSHSPYFYNQFASRVMKFNGIESGEVFELTNSNQTGSLKMVQNFIGVQSNSDVLGFDRNMKALLRSSSLKDEYIGAINSHDYDLNVLFALEGIKHLLKDAKALFMSFENLKSRDWSALRKVHFENKRLFQ